MAAVSRVLSTECQVEVPDNVFDKLCTVVFVKLWAVGEGEVICLTCPRYDVNDVQQSQISSCFHNCSSLTLPCMVMSMGLTKLGLLLLLLVAPLQVSQFGIAQPFIRSQTVSAALL